MRIREARYEDLDGIWEIFSQVIQSGDTYVFDSKTPKAHLQKHWFMPNMKTYVVEDKEQKILGTYILKPNQPDRGSHVANASYMVRPSAQGQGIGSLMCEHSIKVAIQIGYLAMQFNIVVSTNKSAIRLWEKFGFKIIGTIPEGFKHSDLGFVDTYVMWRKL